MRYFILRALTVVLLKICFRFKVEGLKNLPQKTNFIVVANHTSFLDPILIAAAIPQRVYWITLKNIYHAFGLRWIMNMTNALSTGSASEKATYLLLKNKNVGIFPEGTRSFDGQLREFRRGAALLALKTGRPIVPCAILGAYTALPRTARFPRFVPITVKIGRPRYLLKEFTETIDDVCLQEGLFKIKTAIIEMMYVR